MFENISIKKKLAGLVVVFILLFITAKKRSYTVTYNMYMQVNDIEKKLDYIKNSTSSINQLQKEIANYDNIIGEQNIYPELIQQNLLNFSSSLDYIGITGLYETHYAQLNGFNVATNRLNAEGDINKQLKFLYKLEKEFNYSAITNYKLYKEKQDSNSETLQSLITFQYYDKIK